MICFCFGIIEIPLILLTIVVLILSIFLGKEFRKKWVGAMKDMAAILKKHNSSCCNCSKEETK